MKKIYWIYLNRLDENISKAPRLEIADGLADQNYSVTLLTGFRRKTYLPKKYRIKVIYFNGLNIKGLFKIFLSMAIFLWLMRNAQKNDIVIMQTSSLWMSRPLQLFRNCRIHLDIRTIPVEINDIKSRVEYFLYWYMPLILFQKSPNSFSFITELLKKKVEKEFKIRFKDYVVWHSGVNIDHFKPVRKHRKKKSENFTITYLGVLTKNRGIDLVLMAISKLKKQYKEKIVFQVIGDGPYKRNLKLLSQKLGIFNSVVFEGYVPYEKVPEHLVGSDCFICPLPYRIEWSVSSPIKLFEYLACTKPIILTPIPAHKNIISSNKYIVWTDGDKVHDFTRAIEDAYMNRKILIENSRSALNDIFGKHEWKTQARIFHNYLKGAF